MSSSKRILVTGGAGFLGINLIRRLLAEDEGHQVVAMDNFFSAQKLHLRGLERDSEGKLEIVEHDVCHPLTVEGPVDQIYHLACPASPPRYQANPFFTLDTCYLGTKNTLAFAKEKGAVLLFASTSEIYGDPKVSPQTEGYRGNTNTLGIRACYDEGKRVAETLCMEAFRQWDLSVKIVRIFNTYGPFMDPEDGRVVSNFIIQAIKQEPITIYGDGKQTRSFCYVEDNIEGLTRMMNSERGITGPVNIGNPHEFTILELVKKLEMLIGRRLEKRHFPFPEDDPMQRRPDIARAAEVLNWAPKVQLEAGLAKTMEFFKQHLSIQ